MITQFSFWLLFSAFVVQAAVCVYALVQWQRAQKRLDVALAWLRSAGLLEKERREDGNE